MTTKVNFHSFQEVESWIEIKLNNSYEIVFGDKELNDSPAYLISIPKRDSYSSSFLSATSLHCPGTSMIYTFPHFPQGLFA